MNPHIDNENRVLMSRFVSLLRRGMQAHPLRGCPIHRSLNAMDGFSSIHPTPPCENPAY